MRTADRRAVVEALEDVAQGTDARFLVAPARDGWVAVRPSTSAQVMDPGEAIAQRLPAVGDVLRTMVHDDDVLWYCYWRRGEAVDQYCSWPEYFDIASDEERRSVAGQPEAFADLLGDPAKVASLRQLLDEARRGEGAQGPASAGLAMQELAEEMDLANHPERMAEYQQRIQEQFTDVFEAGPAEAVLASTYLARFAELLGLPHALTSYEYVIQDEEGVEDRGLIDDFDQWVHVPPDAL